MTGGLELLESRLRPRKDMVTVRCIFSFEMRGEAGHASIGSQGRFLRLSPRTKETGEDKFSASNVTQALTIPGLKAGIYHWLVHLCISEMYPT